MFGLKISVRVQTFRRVPPVLPRNFCHPATYVDVVPNGFGSKKNNQKCLFYQAVVYQTTSKPLATQEDVEAAIAEVMITQP